MRSIPASAASPSPLVSVVIPAWNADAWIAQAIRSVLVQSVPDLEVLVVDDGSTDRTVAVVRGFDDSRVRLCRQANLGPSAARNKGLAAARGPYIAFLDADDWWDDSKLERQVRYLETHPDCGAVGCLLHYVSSEGRILGLNGHAIAPGDRERIARGEFYPFQAMSSLVMRAELVASTGPFDEPLGRVGSEDIDFLARLAQVAEVATLPDVLGAYRIHPASTMARDARRVSDAARFVKHRLAARREGGDLTWDCFQAGQRLRFADRRQDVAQWWYRRAALWYGEHRLVKAVACGLCALAIGPRYTVRRVLHQRQWRPASPLEGHNA